MYRQTEDLPATAPAKTGRYHELAEAIRRGAAKTSASHGATFVYERNALSPCKTCVLGSALLGAGITHLNYDHRYEVTIRQFGISERFAREIEARFEGYYTWRNNRRQSREEIADWLDSL